MKYPSKMEVMKLIRETYGLGMLEAKALLESMAADERQPTKREQLVMAAIQGLAGNSYVERVPKHALEIADETLRLLNENPGPVKSVTESQYFLRHISSDIKTFATDTLTDEQRETFPYAVFTKKSPSVLGSLIALATSEETAKDIVIALNKDLK